MRRSSGVDVVGPILQGFPKPLNAPPRDARPDEVVDTILATAVQRASTSEPASTPRTGGRDPV